MTNSSTLNFYKFILTFSYYLPLPTTQWFCTNSTTGPSPNRVTGPLHSSMAMPVFIMLMLLVSNSSIFNSYVLMLFLKLI